MSSRSSVEGAARTARDASTRPVTLQGVLRAIVRMALFAAAAALFGLAALADAAWFERHVVLPATYLPPPPAWILPALRLSAALLGIALAACAWAIGRVTAGAVARALCAVALALAASELALRLWPRHEFRIEAQLGAPDARTGWAFVPRRSLQLRQVRYDVDAQGDRAPSPDWREDRDAPTAIVTGESIATGHGLQWSETFAAQLGERLRAQVVDVAEGG